MEEDIKILEELKELNYFGDTVFKREAQAIRNLLKDYKDLKLKERNRVLGRYGEIEVHDLINKVLSEDYIPKSKVKEKIEELEKEVKDYQCEKNRINFYQRKVLQELLDGDD